MSTTRYLSAGQPGAGVTVDNLASRVKAWANVNQIPATAVLRSSFGVSSLTDQGVGIADFAMALPFSAVTAFSAVGMPRNNVASATVIGSEAFMTVSNVRLASINAATNAQADNYFDMLAIGTLAGQ